MDISTIKKALDSLEGWPNRIGIIGGEPTFHPEFEEICFLLQKRNDKRKYGLWTIGGKKYEKYKKLINETFGMIAYNEHNSKQRELCKHQPLTIAIQDVVEDTDYRNELIDKCWAQRTWCPSIGPKGGFFCEVAYAIDSILDGPGGYPVESGWWKKTPGEFADQVDRYCKYCGMPIPMERELIKEKKEKMSPELHDLFKQHDLLRLSADDVIMHTRKFTTEELEKAKKIWDPSNYREDIRPDIEEGWEKRR